MKKAIAVVLLAAGCHSPQDYDPQEAYDAVPRSEPIKVDHQVDPPAGPLQYLAMSADNKYALCGWTENRSVAEAAGRAFEDKHPRLDWYILWRQKPSW